MFRISCVCVLNFLCVWVRVLCAWLVSGEQKRTPDVLTWLLGAAVRAGSSVRALLISLTCPSSPTLFGWDTVWTWSSLFGPDWPVSPRVCLPWPLRTVPAEVHRNAWLTRIPGLPALTLRRVKCALPTKPLLYPHFSNFLGSSNTFFRDVSASFSFLSSLAYHVCSNFLLSPRSPSALVSSAIKSLLSHLSFYIMMFQLRNFFLIWRTHF